MPGESRYLALAIPALLGAMCLALTGCGASHTGGSRALNVRPLVEYSEPQPSAGGWPVQLPADRVLPGERLDENGRVLAPKQPDYINATSIFVPGVMRYADGGEGVNNDGKALHLTSGFSGSRLITWASYRLALGSDQPGAVAVDVNRLPVSSGAISTYWIGLSDYASERWQWHGPFSDHHIRMSTAAAVADGANFVSPLGNMFICIVAYDGAVLQIVGVTANALDTADSEVPPPPSGLTATPFDGCLELSWKGVAADDLAGYRVYYSDQHFDEASEAGVLSVPFLEDVPHHVLKTDAVAWVCVSAVDVSGNESAPTEITSAEPLAGEAPELLLAASRSSGMVGDTITLQAEGAAEYCWDLDTDGLYEVTGDLFGEQALQPEKIGILRPSVMGYSGESGLAISGLSLLIVVNNPPVAVLVSDVMAGEEPLAVNLDASESWDSDGVIINYEWDLDGDDNFNEPGAEADLQGVSAFPYLFEDAGYRYIHVRVTDDIYSQDTAAIELTVRGWVIIMIEASIGEEGERCSLAVVDGAPALCYVDAADHDLRYVRSLSSTGVRPSDWDEIITVDPECWAGSSPSLVVVEGRPAIAYEDAWNYDLRYIRAMNSTGSNPYDWPSPAVVDSTGWVGVDPCLAIIDDNPAISYYDLSKADLKYARSTTSTGQSLSDWSQKVTVDSDGIVGARSTLAVVDGNPAISYTDWTGNLLKYTRATTSTGALAPDWPEPVTVDDTGELGDCRSLAVIAGHPALTYFMELNPVSHDTFDLIYVRSKTSTGDSGLDWSQLVTADSENETGSFSSLATVAGYPAASYFDRTTNALKFAQSATLTGSGAGDWSAIATVDAMEYKGFATTLLDVEGSPAIAYVVATNASSTAKCLKYAWYFQ